jgi:hypothetical protein
MRDFVLPVHEFCGRPNEFELQREWRGRSVARKDLNGSLLENKGRDSCMRAAAFPSGARMT